jgi:hypothetical protein
MRITLTVPQTVQGVIVSAPADRHINPSSRARAERRWRARSSPKAPDTVRATVLRAVRLFYCYTVDDVADFAQLPRDLASGVLELLAAEGLLRKTTRPVPCSETRETLFIPKD